MENAQLAGPDAILAGVTRYADFTVASGIARERGMEALSLSHLTGRATPIGDMLQDAARAAREADSHFWVFTRKG